MGAVDFSIDVSLVALLKRELALDLFIETGTFEGQTLEIAAPYFENLFSVDISENYYHAAKQRFGAQQNIHLSYGDSPTFLKNLQPSVGKRSVLYWLDAHWCAAENVGGEGSQCPLLAELEAIGNLNDKSLILIDDARLFLSPPPAPHEVGHWPSLDQVIKKMFSLSSVHEITVVNDVIVFVPHMVQKLVWEHAHRNSINWLTALDKSRDYDLLHGQLIEKDREIAGQAQEAAQKDQEIAEKEKLILGLREELRKLGESLVYKTAFLLAHPGRVLKSLVQHRSWPQP